MAKRLVLGFVTIIAISGIIFFYFSATRTLAPTTEPFKNTRKDFSYNIKEYASTKSIPLALQTKDKSLIFSTTFNRGGGDCQTVKLVKNNTEYNIIFANEDGILQDLIVTCELSGRIDNIPSGKYILQIMDGNNESKPELINHKEFHI